MVQTHEFIKTCRSFVEKIIITSKTNKQKKKKKKKKKEKKN